MLIFKKFPKSFPFLNQKGGKYFYFPLYFATSGYEEKFFFQKISLFSPQCHMLSPFPLFHCGRPSFLATSPQPDLRSFFRSNQGVCSLPVLVGPCSSCSSSRQDDLGHFRPLDSRDINGSSRGLKEPIILPRCWPCLSYH